MQTGSDYKIASGVVLAAGVNTITMSYTGAEDSGSDMTDGFIKDAEQGGLARNYYIDITAGAGTLTVLGHTDEDAAENIDPTYFGTGYTNPPKEGTVLNVEDVMKRKILVQLVKNDSGRLLDVKEDNIPIYYTTTLSTFVDASPRNTDSDGQVEIRLNPGTVAGNALVTPCFPDVFCTDEDVAIAPGAPVSCAITKGLNTEVQAGDLQEIEATIYDQFGNVISNDPTAPLVTFDITSSPGPDADLDEDALPPFTGDGDGFEQEIAQLGIADVDLKTSSTVGNNVVHVFTNGGLDCGTTTVKGILGQAGQVNCEVLGVVADEIVADDCFDVLVTVSDENGNPLPVWESIVEFSLVNTSKTIDSTTFREELFITPYKVQGKLNPDTPAQALVTVCGCDALGTLDIQCRTDTLDDGTDRLNVINSRPTCIDVQTEERENECDDIMKLHSSILDTCGNKVVDQECGNVLGGGSATSCILLEASCGTLSTEKTCIHLFLTGKAPLVDLEI